ncbi:MAG: hypothetical protein EON85_06650, partial [Brevundimonas sp.]
MTLTHRVAARTAFIRGQQAVIVGVQTGEGLFSASADGRDLNRPAFPMPVMTTARPVRTPLRGGSLG